MEDGASNQFDAIDLDPEDEDILQNIGLGSIHTNRKNTRHIIFVEDEESGAFVNG